MREVWFIHDHFLFEVTAYKELSGWLRTSCRRGDLSEAKSGAIK